MKKFTSLLRFFLVICMISALVFTGCKKGNSDQPAGEDGPFNEIIFTNPDDSQIYAIENNGRQIIYSGVKDSLGMPVKLTQVVVDGEDKNPESRVMFLLDDQGRVKSISNPGAGIMEFTYVSDTSYVLAYTSPDSAATYQFTFNPKNPVKGQNKCGCPGSGNPDQAALLGKSSYYPGLSLIPINYWGNEKNYDKGLLVPGPLSGQVGTKYVPGNYGVPGLLVRGDWRLPDGKAGVLVLDRAADDLGFYYNLPAGPAPPVPPGMMEEVIKFIKTAGMILCAPNTLVGFFIPTICAKLVAPPLVAKCIIFLKAYSYLCKANTIKTIESFTYDFNTTVEVSFIFTAQHPAYKTAYRSASWNPTVPVLPSVSFIYEPYSVFTALYTVPANPAWKQGYMIVAKLVNAGSPPVTVYIKVVGECGFVIEKTFYNVPAGGYCNLAVPPGAIGKWDNITAIIVTSGTPEDGQYRTLRVNF